MAPTSRAETMAALGSVTLFSALNKRQLAAVAKVAENVTFEPGALIIKELDVGHRLVVILDGTANVLRKGVVTDSEGRIEEGASRRLATVGPGDVLGELAVIDGKPTSASVVAATEVEALLVSRTAFVKLVDSMPELCGRLLAALAARVREAGHRGDMPELP